MIYVEWMSFPAEAPFLSTADWKPPAPPEILHKKVAGMQLTVEGLRSTLEAFDGGLSVAALYDCQAAGGRIVAVHLGRHPDLGVPAILLEVE